ncbi:DUF6218 family protein [Actinokineospora iranica]|uniref:Uncharacterized protein n=1 Tax=Actinokineospora iranica TaxID=1271860 RepID=A0A1G6WJN0_9PSEU|nr:DUF6218 family protein [Actinokineospora iranica]SDD66170.1 hypothetical protein SAMN05216174_11548 [Actinokineospora iranica]
MTEPTPPPRPAAARTRTADGRVMIGHAVVARGPGEDGADSVAVWQIGTHGAQVGTWLLPVAALDAERAGKLLAQCEKRAIVAWSADEPLDVLATLERAAGARPREWRLVLLPDALGEIAEVRARYAAAVKAERAATSTVPSLEWQVGIPDPIPATAEEFRRHARVPRRRDTALVAQEALLTCAMMTWAVHRWQETAGAWSRRDHLRRACPAPGVLPPAWERRLADAYATRL